MSYQAMKRLRGNWNTYYKVEKKKPLEGYILCNSNWYYAKGRNCGGTKKISGFHGLVAS